MKVDIEWMDEVTRTYDNIDKAEPGNDQVLRLYGQRLIGGPAELIVAIPHGNVRTWTVSGRR